jgi:hypothetical protein
MTTLLAKASVLLIALLLQACAAQETQLPATTRVLDSLPRVQNSAKAPCWQQKQIAAQNSYLDTVIEKKDAVYKAPCEIDPKKPVRVAEGKAP